MNEKVENKKNRKNNKKTSIITVFLFIVLMFTITVIAVNNTNKTNALEEADAKHITKIEKRLIEDENQLPDEIKESLRLSGDVIYYVGKEYYVITDVGSTIKLVYKVTVAGDEGANYTVTDTDAERIGGDLESGYIPASGKVDIYYKGEYKITEDTKKLVNTAVVTPGKYSYSSSSATESTLVLIQKKINFKGIKIWDDNENMSNKRNENVTLQLKVGDNVINEAEVSESNNWTCEFEVPKYNGFGDEIEYYVDEKENENIFYEKELTNNTTVTNKFKVPDEKVIIKAEKIWEDENNKYLKRPESVVLQIKNKDEIIEEKSVYDSNSWTYEFEVPKYDELGNEIMYTVDEKETSEFYEKRVDGYKIINKYKNIDEDKNDNVENKENGVINVDTSDINVFVYVVIFFVAIVGVICVIFFVRESKNRKM